jgi:putative transposase
VDTQGLVLKVQLTSAQVHDTVGAQSLIASCRSQLPRLGIIWADQAYRGPLVEWMQEQHRLRLEIVYRTTPEQRKEQVWEIARQRQREGASVIEIWSGLSWQGQIEVLPRRWVVERTFAWLGKCRRLCRDYEQLPQTGEAWIYLAMTRLMLRRLAKIKDAKAGQKPTRTRKK